MARIQFTLSLSLLYGETRGGCWTLYIVVVTSRAAAGTFQSMQQEGVLLAASECLFNGPSSSSDVGKVNTAACLEHGLSLSRTTPIAYIYRLDKQFSKKKNA